MPPGNICFANKVLLVQPYLFIYILPVARVLCDLLAQLAKPKYFPPCLLSTLTDRKSKQAGTSPGIIMKSSLSLPTRPLMTTVTRQVR